MKLSKAKEILYDQSLNPALAKLPDLRDALKLGIDCITYCAQVRRFPHEADNIPIPGDTED